MLILNAADVRRALPMAEAIAALRTAFAALASGRADVPPRTHLRIEEHDGDTLVMPAFLNCDASEAALAVKVVSVFPKNGEANLPRINAAVLVLDPTTGIPIALLEGATLTGIRTAAASALATDLLSRPDSRTLAIFGAGVQARTHLEAICTVRTIETAWIFSPTAERVDRLISELAGRGPIPTDVRRATSPAEAVSLADIACTVTTSPVPVFDDGNLRPGTHINAVGSYKPQVAEVPPETLARALVVVDERTAAWQEAGDLIQPLRAGLIGEDHVHADLGELVSRAKSGRTTAEQITLFKSVGIAAEDAATAQRAVQNAVRMNLGQCMSWSG
jgi:alanine dehydrogenase